MDGFQLLKLINMREADTIVRRQDFRNIGSIIMYTGQASQTKVELIAENDAAYLPKEVSSKEIEPFLYGHITQNRAR